MSNKYEAMYAGLGFTDDFLFCKILENNPDLCKELLELILGIEIKKVDCVSKQKTIDAKADGKGIRLDVYVKDNDNTVFDIEIQTTKQKDLPKRTRYYQGMIDMDLIQKGEKYKVLKKSYVIFICLSDPFNLQYPVYHFENICKENKELVLGDEAYKVFVNATGARANVSEDMKAFLDFLEGKESNNHLVKKLQREVEKARNQEEWRKEFVFLAERDENNRKEGRKEEQRRLIMENYTDGTPIPEIAKFMKISEDEVKQIIEENQELVEV